MGQNRYTKKEKKTTNKQHSRENTTPPETYDTKSQINAVESASSTPTPYRQPGNQIDAVESVSSTSTAYR
jgi:hypothetical protein